MRKDIDMGNVRKTLTEEDYERIISSKLIFNKTIPAIAEEIGCGETAVNMLASTFTVCQRRDWERAVDMIENKKYSIKAFTWSCKKLGIQVPRSLQEAADRMSEAGRQERLQKMAAKTVTEKAEPSDNENLYFIKILEALNQQNELLTQLIDVVIPKYVCDMKDNRNVNTDLLNKTLQSMDEKLEGIKANTRKRGL